MEADDYVCPIGYVGLLLYAYLQTKVTKTIWSKAGGEQGDVDLECVMSLLQLVLTAPLPSNLLILPSGGDDRNKLLDKKKLFRAPAAG